MDWLRTCFLFFVFSIALVECVITDVRLVGGPVSNKGTVEIRQDNGIWETTCGTNLWINDVIVICKHLGFTGASRAIEDTPFGQNSIPTIGLHCDGDEADLSECGTFQATSCLSAGGASCYGEGYLGCFVDSVTDRVLQVPVVVGDPQMTISKCIQLCNESTTANNVYAGVENGNECFCGEESDDYDRLGVVSDAWCQSPCSGDPTESCGAGGYIAVFIITAEISETTPDVGTVKRTEELTSTVFLITNQPEVTSDNKDVMTSSGITTYLITPTLQQRGRDSCLGVGVGEGIVIIILLLTIITLVVYILRNRATHGGGENDRDTHDMTLAKKPLSKDEDNSFYQDIEDVKTQGTSSPTSREALYSSKIYEQKGGNAVDIMDMDRKEIRNNADPYVEII